MHVRLRLARARIPRRSWLAAAVAGRVQCGHSAAQTWPRMSLGRLRSLGDGGIVMALESEESARRIGDAYRIY